MADMYPLHRASVLVPETGDLPRFTLHIQLSTSACRLAIIGGVYVEPSDRESGVLCSEIVPPGNLCLPDAVFHYMRMVYSLSWVGWNTYLAVIPVMLGYVIAHVAARPKRSLATNVGVWVLVIMWLAFLPNTCYLLTEWRHYLINLDSSNMYLRAQADPATAMKLLLYTAFYLCFSGIGMLTFTLAIRPLARLAEKRGLNIRAPAILLFLMLSVGVYLGLILRFNSWDLLTRPAEVWASATGILHRPLLAAFIVAFGGFLWLAYTAIDIWVDGFAARWKRAVI